MNNRRAIIFIDTETALEGPWRETPALPQLLAVVTAVLSLRRVPAVFNACGKLIQLFPADFRRLEAAGHEIALHGWEHENLRMLDDQSLKQILEQSHEAYLQALSHQPAGFRAPWLEYDQRLETWLSAQGYSWASHDHRPFRERFLTPALRPELRRSRWLGAWWSAAQELCFSGAPRRITDTLWEIPLTSSMDGELLGLVSPQQPSPVAVVEYCRDAWLAQARRYRTCFTLNVHDWLIGTANRLELLDRIILGLQKAGLIFTTASQLIQGIHADAG